MFVLYTKAPPDTRKLSLPEAHMIRKLNVMMYDRGRGIVVVHILLYVEPCMHNLIVQHLIKEK